MNVVKGLIVVGLQYYSTALTSPQREKMRLGGNKYRIIFSCWIHNIKIEKCEANSIAAQVATSICSVIRSIADHARYNLNCAVLNIAEHKKTPPSSGYSPHRTQVHLCDRHLQQIFSLLAVLDTRCPQI